MAATAQRAIFVNWVTKKLQRSATDGSEILLPVFVKYETVPLRVIILEPDPTEGSRRFARVDISNLALQVSINQTYDTASPLAQQGTWTKDELLNEFSGELALNTAGLNTYLGSSSTMPAYIEIEITEGTARSKIYVAGITLQNAVAQVSSVAPTPLDEYYTKAQIEQQFVKKVMAANETLTFTTPDGTYQRVLGAGDGQNPIDQWFPV